jgi:multiple sugar transport system substrate-binding protein
VEKEELVHSRPPRVLGLLAAAMLVVGACGGNPTSPGASAGPATGAPATAAPGTAAPPTFAAADLRWYCCLGTGEDPAQVPTENEVAAGFAEKYPGSTLKFEVVTYDSARATLSTQIAAGNAPDIVGPAGVGGIAAFKGQWLDLDPLITKWGYDTSQFDPGAVSFYHNDDEGQFGLPFAIYPSMLWYKNDHFTDAGLNPPPHKYGEKYKMPDGTEVDWDYDTIREIAKILTVDANGNDATSADFDPTKIEQYGFEVQRDDLRGLGAYFGAGNLTGADGKTVTIPDAWKDGWKFFYDGMWKDHFIMTGPVYETDEFNGGGYSFFSGRVAMAENFLWTTYGVADAGTDWDLGAIPSHNGTTTSPLNADTFAVMKGSKNPDAAFAAFTYLIGDASDELLGLYGGMPARPDKQDAFFDALDASTGEDGEVRFPQGVDWQVAKDSVQYADNPNFEAYMPKYNETLTILGTYLSKWTTTPGLNMDAEIEALRAEVQAEWDK